MSNKDQQIKKLTQLNDELESYFRNTIIPQLFIDADFRLRKFTPPAMKHFSLSSDDIGKQLHDLKENFRFPAIIDCIQEVIESKGILEKEIQTTDFRWYQMNIIPYVAVKNNKTNGVIITFVDITRRIGALKELEKLVLDHETLLDVISHDIKTPLTNMALTIDLLKNAPPQDAQKFQSLLKIAETGIKKMQRIITELTDTRHEEYKYKASEELLYFEDLLEDVRLTLTDNIIEYGTVITTEINVTEIIYSRKKLRSIIYNLVNNAIKFRASDRESRIWIKTEWENGFIILSVKDNGIGIDPDKQDAVFSKYFRVENAVEGSGIGLYLVNEIITNSGGKILLESQPGKGSEFRVYLKN